MKELMEKLDKFLEEIFAKKLPALPKNAKEWIVKALPWLALIFGIIAIPGLLAVFGFGAVTAPFWAFRGMRSMLVIIVFLLGAVQVILELLAVSPLFKRARKGWELLYKSSLLGVVTGILNFSGFGLLTTLVTLYLLYQIKKEYH